MDGRCKSLGGNKYAQVMANKDFFAVAYPMGSKSGACDALRQFINEYGRPEKLTFDGSQEQCGSKTEFISNVRKYSIDYHVTEPYRPNHNFAEGVIREIRKKWFRVMTRNACGIMVYNGCATYKTAPLIVHEDSMDAVHSSA